jgi:hypothetical protein
MKERDQLDIDRIAFFGLDAKPYPYLNDVLGFLHSERIGFEIKKAPFEFQRGGNLMLKLYADKRCFAK